MHPHISRTNTPEQIVGLGNAGTFGKLSPCYNTSVYLMPSYRQNTHRENEIFSHKHHIHKVGIGPMLCKT